MSAASSPATLESLRPLDGVRVVNLSLNLPGPVAAARLLRMGAHVTQIVPPSGDPLELYNPAFYRSLHAGQELLRLDLKIPDDRAQFDALLSSSDLLLTAFRPAALDRLSLGWAALHARHPRLCQVALVGDASGAENVPGHDLTYQAERGLVAPPAMPLTLVADMAGAERMVTTALALLLARARSQQGSCAQVALTAAAEDMALPLYQKMTTPDGFLGGGSPFYNLYRAQDGWVALAALEPHFQKRLLAELQLENVEKTARRDALAAIFAARSAADWQLWAAQRDLPLVAVRVAA
ncbi:MAG: CoA transferase [Acidobacteriia bacterium]|nr:CoA transferase [Terriglobia bacterium]